jgi:ACS family glucarate transporter-like MFS transporter
MNMGGQLGGALTASVTPAIAQQYGWTSSFLVAAVLSIAGGLAWLLVEPDRPLSGVGAEFGVLMEDGKKA